MGDCLRNEAATGLQLIRNLGGGANHFAVLEPLLRDCKSAVLCSGWLKANGAPLLAARGQGVPVTIYTNQENTPPDAADLVATMPGVTHRIVPNAKDGKVRRYLHAKLYFFEHHDRTYTAVVGSANITDGALHSNLELSVRHAGTMGDPLQLELAAFLEEVHRKSVPAAEVRDELEMPEEKPRRQRRKKKGSGQAPAKAAAA